MGELDALLGGGLKIVEELEVKSADLRVAASPGASSMMTIEDKAAIFHEIEKAFDVVNTISTDISKILEALSFQDLSGQQILKIIKLLSDFQIQLLAIVVSFGSQLKRKESDAAISEEESRKLVQDDVDVCFAKIESAKDSESGALDQDDVNMILEDLGF